MSKYAIGCDLGSTLSEVAIIEGNEPTIIVSSEGSRTFPSVVCIDSKTKERKVGATAKRQALINPKNTINLVKRFMGRKIDDPEVIEAKKHVQYDIVDHNGWAYIVLDGKPYSPQEISSWILASLKQMAEEYTGETITDAVITVPAMFPDSARTATKEAGELAGLNVLRIINEPTAATLASKLTESGKYMVADSGGSTTDFSVVDYDKDTSVMEILASDGDTFLGGSDFDNALSDYVCDEFKKNSGIDLKKDSMAMQRIMEAVEKAKIELSGSSQTEINLPYITVADGTPQHLTQTINKSKFEQIVSPLVDRLLKCAKISIEKSKLDKIDGIILVGGTCRIPCVQARLEKELNAPLIKKADFDLAVAQGAAIQANILAGNTSSTDVLLLDVMPLSLGIETMGGYMAKMIEANTTIPTKKTEVFSTAADNQTMVQIVVAQGERTMVKDNKIIGTFNLDGIMPAPRGVPQIEVTFDIDASGIVNVSAKDKATGKEQRVTITNSTSLSKDEIDRIKADAEAHKAEDEAKKKEIEEINKAETLVFSIENAMKSLSDKISEEEKNSVESKIKDVKSAIEAKNLDSIKKEMNALNDIWNPIVQKMYGGGSNNAQGGAFGGSNPFNGDSPFGGFGFGGNQSNQTPTDNGGNSEADFEEVK